MDGRGETLFAYILYSGQHELDMDVDVEASDDNVDDPRANTQGLLAQREGRCMSTQAMQSLYDLRQNNLLCDAVLRLEDGGVFPIHRAILSVCSTYFRFSNFTLPLYTTYFQPYHLYHIIFQPCWQYLIHSTHLLFFSWLLHVPTIYLLLNAWKIIARDSCTNQPIKSL